MCGKDSEAADDSPSLLKGRRKKDGVIGKERVEDEDEDDFVECVKPRSAEVPKRRSPRKAKASSSSAPASTTTTTALPKRVKVTNRFGITTDEEWTMSQKRRVQNMRQGKIRQFLGAKKSEGPAAASDEEMERARLESLKTYEDEKRRSRSPLGLLDNSFDRLTSDDDETDNRGNFKRQGHISMEYILDF